MKLPYWEKGANKYHASLVYDANPTRRLYYSGRPNLMTPSFSVTFQGISEAKSANPVALAMLSEGLKMMGHHCSRWTGRNFIMSGKAINPDSVKDGDTILFQFPVFMRDRDRASIYGVVYTGGENQGSSYIWINEYLVLSDLASIAQFATQASHAATFIRAESAKYTKP